MTLLGRLFGNPDPAKARVRALYEEVVELARAPHWYVAGAVPDTIDGRFDMVALVLCIVLLRLEHEGDAGRAPAVHLAELFVDDMDPQLRQMGIGDLVVGKHVGRMMGALGGRLAAYRAAFYDGAPLEPALVRNLWRGAAPDTSALVHVAAAVRRLDAAVRAAPLDHLLAGEIAA